MSQKLKIKYITLFFSNNKILIYAMRFNTMKTKVIDEQVINYYF